MGTAVKIIALVAGLSLSLMGCGAPVKGYLKPSVTISDTKSLAVIPFDNNSGQPDAGRKVGNLLLTELVQKEMFQIADMGEVENSLRRLRIRTAAEMDLSKLKSLGEQLGVQVVIIGSVYEYDLRQVRGGTVPVVALSARMLDIQTGDILWAVSHTRDGNDWETVFGFGRIISLSRLARIVVSEVLESLTDELQKRAKAERRWQRERLK